MKLPSWTRTLLLGLGIALAAAASRAAESVLVVYDTRSGHTQALARAIGEGIETVEGVDAVVKSTKEVEDQDVVSSAGIVLGSPVHWGSLSSEAKAFLERVGSALLGAKELGPQSTARVRTAGAFSTGGAVSSGKELARITILTGFLNMRFVVVGGEENDGFGTLGAQATTGESDPGLSDKELEEARRFGARFAAITLALRNQGN